VIQAIADLEGADLIDTQNRRDHAVPKAGGGIEEEMNRSSLAGAAVVAMPSNTT